MFLLMAMKYLVFIPINLHTSSVLKVILICLINSGYALVNQTANS
jgi:hypothetical protein